MRRTAVALTCVGLLLLGLRLVALQTVRVESTSMRPTLDPGDVALVLRPGEVGPGDVVVAEQPQGTRVVKRVAAVGGQRVGVQDGELCVDGRCRQEPWVVPDHVDGTFFGPVTVPAGHVFLLGDARDASVDSRTLGPVPLEAVVGRVVASW